MPEAYNTIVIDAGRHPLTLRAIAASSWAVYREQFKEMGSDEAVLRNLFIAWSAGFVNAFSFIGGSFFAADGEGTEEAFEAVCYLCMRLGDEGERISKEGGLDPAEFGH